MKKRKFKNIFIIFLLIIFIILFLVSLINIINYFINAKKMNKEMDLINNNITVTEKEDTISTEIINNSNNLEDPYYDYIKLKLVDVDFTKLKNINDSTVGFISVGGTNINYPVVQAHDNSFYLNHTFDKSYNKYGWIFADYRNNFKDFDKNTIIYGHGMINDLLFGTLRKILTNGWLDNTDNHIVRLSSENENTLWQVFSVYKIKTTSDYLDINFNNDLEYNNFINLITSRSFYNFKASVTSKDKILTLSTCYNYQDKVVMHAKLIKKENKV